MVRLLLTKYGNGCILITALPETSLVVASLIYLSAKTAKAWKKAGETDAKRSLFQMLKTI
jgi:hypothetical protein